MKSQIVICCNAYKCKCKGCSHSKPHALEIVNGNAPCTNVDQCGETEEDVYCSAEFLNSKDPNILFQMQRGKCGHRSKN